MTKTFILRRDRETVKFIYTIFINPQNPSDEAVECVQVCADKETKCCSVTEGRAIYKGFLNAGYHK